MFAWSAEATDGVSFGSCCGPVTAGGQPCHDRAAIADVAAGFIPGTRRLQAARIVKVGDAEDLEAWLGLTDLVLI